MLPSESLPESPSFNYTRIRRITQIYSRPEDITLTRSFFGLSAEPGGYAGIDNQFIQKVSDFQRQNHLAKVDGILGPATLNAIKNKRHTQSNQKISVGATPNIQVDRFTIPDLWQPLFTEACQKIGQSGIEKIKNGAPLILVDSGAQKGFAMLGEKSFTFPVALGRGGVKRLDDSGSISSLKGTGATGAGLVYRFHDAKIPSNPFADASRSGSREEVIGASLFSPEGIAGGGRWFHGVSDTSKNTAGCIGLPVPEIRTLAQAVKEYGAGYGYVG